MTHEALVLSLNAAQVDQVVSYCVAYRAHAWREIAPTAERNQTLRAVQAVRSKSHPSAFFVLDTSVRFCQGGEIHPFLSRRERTIRSVPNQHIPLL